MFRFLFRVRFVCLGYVSLVVFRVGFIVQGMFRFLFRVRFVCLGYASFGTFRVGFVV